MTHKIAINGVVRDMTAEEIKNYEEVKAEGLAESENLKNQFIKKMNNSKIKIIRMDKQKLRMVTHRNYTEEQHEYVLESLKKLC